MPLVLFCKMWPSEEFAGRPEAQSWRCAIIKPFLFFATRVLLKCTAVLTRPCLMSQAKAKRRKLTLFPLRPFPLKHGATPATTADRPLACGDKVLAEFLFRFNCGGEADVCKFSPFFSWVWTKNVRKTKSPFLGICVGCGGMFRER